MVKRTRCVLWTKRRDRRIGPGSACTVRCTLCRRSPCHIQRSSYCTPGTLEVRHVKSMSNSGTCHQPACSLPDTPCRRRQKNTRHTRRWTWSRGSMSCQRGNTWADTTNMQMRTCTSCTLWTSHMLRVTREDQTGAQEAAVSVKPITARFTDFKNCGTDGAPSHCLTRWVSG